MGMVWTPIATATILASTVATFFSMVHLRVRWDVHASSVRWLFWLFFLYVFAWCCMRSIYFTWMSFLPVADFVDVHAASVRDVFSVGNGSQPHEEVRDVWTPDKFDRLGIHSILRLEEDKKPLMTLVLCAGDVCLLGIALTLFPLTYELWKLARMSMDRGVKRERRQILIYFIGIHFTMALFVGAQIYFCIKFGGYNVYTHRMLLSIYLMQFVCMVFMGVLLVILKVNGRKYETIHGTFVASPVYQRLKRIMFVYIIFSFQFQLSTLIIYVNDQTTSSGVVSGIGISLILYNCSGLALSITTSCSQACVFSTFAPCLPEDFEASYMHRRFAGQSEAPLDEDLDAPSENPVFVYTDIESSSALWNIGDGEMMDEATEIHDDILRSTLPKYRGYEITTVGDAFQLAFRTIRDAVEYCMDVQLQLLVAKWPKEIHGAVPATTKLRSGRRMVFNGLRVRMGIHDALESEGALVQGVHAVTGKTMYTGASEVVADYVGDMGCGGQIMLTGRVATWIKHHCDDLSVDIFLELVGHYTVPQVNVNVEVFQLLPAILAGRAMFFIPPEKGRLRQDTRSSTRSSTRRRRGTRQPTLQRHQSMPVMSPMSSGYSALETSTSSRRQQPFSSGGYSVLELNRHQEKTKYELMSELLV